MSTVNHHGRLATNLTLHRQCIVRDGNSNETRQSFHIAALVIHTSIRNICTYPPSQKDSLTELKWTELLLNKNKPSSSSQSTAKGWKTAHHNIRSCQKCSLHSLLATSLLYQSSVLSHCWLGVRKSIRPVKIEWWCVGVIICLDQGADCLHIVQLMPQPYQNSIISSLNKIQTGFTYLVLAYPGYPEKRPLNGCSSRSIFAIIRKKCMPALSTNNHNL